MEIEKPTRVATLAVYGDHLGMSLLMGLRQDNWLWTTPGGHLDENESPIAGAVRELREETGIEAKPEELSYLGSVQTTGRTGAPIELHMFQLVAGDRLPSNSDDPDQEVHGWSFVDVSKGLPPGLSSRLHSPKNHLLRALGLMDFQDGPAKLAEGEGKHFAPMNARRDAAEGLRVLAMAGMKPNPIALKRARALVEGRPLEPKDVFEMSAYFELYGNCVGENDVKGMPTERAVDALLWGGPSGAKWARALASTLRSTSGSFRLSSDGSRRRLAREVNKTTEGTITSIKREVGNLVRYVLDTGESWLDSAGKHNVGDKVRVSPYIMGTVKVEKLCQRRLSESEGESTTKKKDRPIHEVSADIQKAGVDDNDNNPEDDREIPGGPRRKTNGELEEDPKDRLET